MFESHKAGLRTGWHLALAALLLASILFSFFKDLRPAEASPVYALDTFTDQAYNNQNGSANWAADWVETNDDGAPTTGGVLATGGELGLNNNLSQAIFESVERSLNMPTNATATLSFDRRTTNTEAGDTLVVEIYDGDTSAWTTLFTYNGAVADGTATRNISGYRSADTRIRFRITGGYTDTNEFFYVDNVRIDFWSVSEHTPSSVYQTVQTYYVPVPEDQGLLALDTINTAANDPMYTYLSITVVADDTVIYYDQWEDGYEAETTSPLQNTTEVWGDNDPATGMSPGFTTDVFSAGDIIVLNNTVPSTNLALVDFDGRDKISATDAIAVTRTSWPSGAGTLHGGSVEMLNTDVWGTRFDIPADAGDQANDFDYAALSVMASQDGTNVYLNGTLVTTLNEGESYLFNDGTISGGNQVTTNAGHPIQANFLTGDIGSSYESSWFTLYPYDLLSSSYYAPVNGTTTPARAVAVYLQNPNASAITVYRKDSSGAVTNMGSIASGATLRYIMPTTGTGMQFYTGTGSSSDPRFQAISVMDSGGYSSDWGYTLIPANQLTQQAQLGWGVGQDPTITPATENGSPAWVLAVGSGTMYVCADYDGDGVGALTDANGSRYDQLLTVTNLQRVKVFDSDGDQTGMLFYLCNGSETANSRGNAIAVAWGQDPATATVDSPGLDVGTSVPPLPNYTAIKNAVLTNDLNGDGKFDIGDTFEYRININNVGALPIPGGLITVSDIVPLYTNYVAGSTAIDGVTIPDAASGTPFPLDEGGYLIPNTLAIDARFIVSFRVTIDASIPAATTIQNDAYVSGLNLSYTPRVEIYVDPPTKIGDFIWLDMNGDGIQDASEPGLQGVTVFLDTNNNGSWDTGEPTTTTNANGKYTFSGLSDGTYHVVVDASTLPGGLTQTGDPDSACPGAGCNNHHTVTLGPGSTNKPYYAADFGYQGSSSIGDFVWNDLDGDGVQEAGEAGISGVTVWVDLDNDGVIDPTEPSAVTDAGGLYSIGGLPAGSYAVRTSGAAISGATPTYDLDGAGTPSVANVTLTAGQNRTDVDFGYQFGVLAIGKISSAGGATMPGDTIQYTLTVRNNTASLHTGIVISDTLPAGTTYVVQSTIVQGYITRIIQDTFPTNGDPDTGSGWSGPWQEYNENDGFSAGDEQITGNALRIRDNDNSGEGAYRQADLSGFTSAWLTLSYTTNGIDNANEDSIIQVSTDGTTWATVYTWDGALGNTSGRVAVDISSYIDSDTLIRFVTSSNFENLDYILIDNVSIGQLIAEDIFPTVGDGTTGTGWVDRWYEIGENDGFNANDIAVIAAGLRIQDNDNGGEGAYREVNLSGYSSAWLSLDYTNVGLDNANEDVTLDISTDGGSNWTTIYTWDGILADGSGSLLVDISNYIDSDTRIRFLGSASLGGTSGITVDNVRVTGAPIVVKIADNIPGGTYPDLANGVPSSLVLAADGFALNPGQVMAVTFQAVVNDPVTGGLASIDNAAEASSAQQPTAQRAEASDRLPAHVGDQVWLDVDGDGVYDPGEPGIPNVQVRLYDPGPDGQPGGGDDTLLSSTTTGSDGRYNFNNWPVERYYVDIVEASLPTGLSLAPGNTDPTGAFATVAGQSYLQADFGYVGAQPGSAALVGDYVWSDADNDGVQDAGEPGISGVSVRLLADDDGDGVYSDQKAIATTDPAGRYYFTGVAAGKYVVQVVEGAGTPLQGYTATSGPQSQGGSTSAPFSVRPGDIYVDADFGYYNASLQTITDRLWYDANRDGLQGAGEPGIPGVTINLLNASGQVIATTVSDSSGSFSFTGLPNGAYTLQVADADDKLVNYSDTTPGAASGSQAVVLSGAGYSGVDFGYVRPASIGDRIWSDADGDGLQDPNEAGMAGVSVGLYDSTGTTLLRTTTTKDDGSYIFTGLAAATYVVRVNGGTPPAGYTQTGDPDQPGMPCTACDSQTSVTLAAGQSYVQADFGYRNPALFQIGDLVWNDRNADGSFDPADGEQGLGGVTLALYKDSDHDGVVDSGEALLATTVTAADGSYSFPGLPDWYTTDQTVPDYVVVVTDQNGVLAGYRQTAGLYPWPVAINNASRSDIDFGFVRTPATAAIGDSIWYDANGDNAQSPTEHGIANVLVNLYSAGPDGLPGGGDDSLLSSAYTDAAGVYLFSSLPPGGYYVEVDASNFSASGDPLYGQQSTSGGNQHSPISLSEGEIYLDADLGYRGVGYAIGDYVWSDANGDGLQDPGEPGLGGITLELVDSSDNLIATTTTTADGHYLFSGLPAGSYKVNVANFNPGLSGYTVTSGPQSVGSPRTGVITLSSFNPDVTYIDFGFRNLGLGSIGDHVWLDKDLDGDDTDAGEPGLADVTVDLIRDLDGDGVWDAGEPVIATTLTDANGNYLFTGLSVDDGDGDADYLVHVSDRNHVLDGLTPTNGATPRPVALTGLQRNVLTVDFGYDDPIVGDYVWHDADHDGVQDPDESGIGGVEVLLYADVDSDGVLDPGQDNLLYTTTTTPDGYYDFGGLPFASFIIKVAGGNFQAGGALAGFSRTLQDNIPMIEPGYDERDSDADADNEISITPLSVKDFTLDFGFYAPTGYTLGNQIWNDTDGDGFRDSGEGGLSDITVDLYRDLNGNGRLDLEDARLGRTTTDSNGQYAFDNLPSGNYIVQVSDLEQRLVDSIWTDGNDNQDDYSQTPTYALYLSGAVNYADFGFRDHPNVPTSAFLSGFSAAAQFGQVQVSWQTLLETNVWGFNLYRSTSPDGPRLLLNPDGVIPAEGLGGLPGGRDYSFEDNDVQPGVTYYYWLETVSLDGSLVLIEMPIQVTGAFGIYIPFVKR